MSKRSNEYWDNLHKVLAEKYGASPLNIARIRQISKSQKINGAGVAEFVRERIKRQEVDLKNILKNINSNRELVKFIVDNKPEIIEEIINFQ